MHIHRYIHILVLGANAIETLVTVVEIFQMPPRKKQNSTSKKSNPNHQNSQPSKFGIQHFFDRHTQNTLSQNPNNSQSSDPNNASKSKPLHAVNGVSNLQNPENGSESGSIHTPQPKIAIDSHQNPKNDLNLGALGRSNEVSAHQSKKKKLNLRSTDANSLSQNTPPDNLFPIAVNDGENQSEASPEISKSVSAKRFKFSPGMLIKQSQDDGGDEVTWKISPVNDRLHAVSKHLPEMVRVLADSSRLNSLNFHCCQQNKSSPRSPGKLEKWLSSPPLKPTEKSLLISNRVNLKRINIHHDVDFHQSQGNANDKNNSCLTNSQSPFKTPPSLSYCHDKPDDIVGSNGVTDQLGSRQHKKALLELLDQVEDVISVDESVCKGTEACLSEVQGRNGDERSDKANPSVKSLVIDLPGKVNKETSNLYFLVLEVSEKCGAINSSGSQLPFKVLRLLNEQSGEERAVHLWDEWFYSVIAPGDTIRVIGEFDNQGKCDVNRDKNYLIIHPDVLMSGTRVAASFSCPRRTVLDERLKCSEQSVAALIGTLLHQVFQAGLMREVLTKEFLEEYARIVLQKNIESLYACGVNEIDLHKTLIEAIPKILNWILLFRDSQDSKIPSVDFRYDDGMKKVKLTEVVDIEEMAWAPKYGLKGMIDASVQVKVISSTNEVCQKIMPLEFKTGKGTSGQTAMEHSAQVMLYTLLMSERYLKTIDHGLLYYLHTDQTQGIVVQRSDLVGLIMRRNELANDILKASTSQQLPPMLKSPNMCKGCRHLNVCTIYHKAHGGTTEGSGLGDMFDSLVHHLTSRHCAFLRQWERLIDLEAKEIQISKKDIWCPSSVRSEKSTSSLSSVVLDTSEELKQTKILKANRFIYRFVRQDLPPIDGEAHDGDSLSAVSSPTDDMNCMLRSGDYVILSTEPSRLTVASGIIMDISRSQVTVSFSKRLRLPGSSPSSAAQDLHQEVWRIDKDEFMASFAIMRFNLIQLFLQNEHSFHLRRMIVDLEAPRFDSGCIFSQDPAISYIWAEKNLNNDQRRAIIRILTAKDYALILGMPGTGKTSTMVHAVKALLMRGASILLTSYTNSAVDNLLIKLKAQGIDFVRIGRNDAVHEEVRGHCFSAMDIHSIEDIKVRLDQIKVVAVTCLGITSPLLVNKRFDVCIMDEAGQTTLPVSLGPLMYASKFVLVGDHYQLPPLVQSTESLENGMGVSLFCRLSEAHPQAISALQNQYRMCASIMDLSNALIYGNRLRCGSSEVENAKLKYTSSKYISSWLKEVLDPNRPVIFINTDMLPALEAKDGKTLNNPVEANIIAEITEELVNKGIEMEDIGIITPYNSQANLIRHDVSSSVEIHTIDKYQGRDKDCILVSFVRSNDSPRNCISSLLGDWHRINVALTRAKKKLIMVGSCKTLSKVPLLKLLIGKVEEQLGILSVSKKDLAQRELKRCSQVKRT
ncbi:DNA replication ATP-dependent helicase/nuclease DNA2 isoform X1 [Camellia sinensis]|uniref:DNA replication ATP-dependent helicase/nuclease DNA2 isoform X1 n=1 Tax=Camellia sinensis TaxID=4442 RepID=UPI0010359E42|nr:DNA replication ATP-dependent helicase/nuclease DNA2 isoform X1 [Camellia sinensis]